MQVPEEIPVIANITRSAPAVTQPETTAKQCLAYYGIGSVIQVAPEQAALFCSLKVSLRWHIDYEDGTDVYIFNTRPGIGKRKPRPITRNEKDGKLEEPRFIMKFPTLPGFWPLNAKNQDGKAHPGAGKGFAWCQALSFPGNGDKFTRKMYEGMKRYLEIMQLEFDGRNLKVTERKVIEPGEDWVTANAGS